MSDNVIVNEVIEGSKGRFEALTAGGAAEMTFSIMSPGMRIVDHTGVPKALEGQGIGKALVEHLVADARAKGYKVVPLCPFVNRMRAAHPEWADAFQVK